MEPTKEQLKFEREICEGLQTSPGQDNEEIYIGEFNDTYISVFVTGTDMGNGDGVMPFSVIAVFTPANNFPNIDYK